MIQLTECRLDDRRDLISAAFKHLSNEEQRRALKFLQLSHRNRYVAAHYFVRKTLAEVLDVMPTQVVFGAERWGKPVLIYPDVQLHFNLSHSGELATLVWSEEHSVGVDIECRTDREIDGVAKMSLSDGEWQRYMAHRDMDRCDFFLRIWTAKEAFLKLNGNGLSVPMNEVEVEDKFYSVQSIHPRLSVRKGRIIEIDGFGCSRCSIVIPSDSMEQVHISRRFWYGN